MGREEISRDIEKAAKITDIGGKITVVLFFLVSISLFLLFNYLYFRSLKKARANGMRSFKDRFKVWIVFLPFRLVTLGFVVGDLIFGYFVFFKGF